MLITNILVLDYLIVVVVVLGLAEPLQPGFPVVTLVIFIVTIIVEIIIIVFIVVLRLLVDIKLVRFLLSPKRRKNVKQL